MKFLSFAETHIDSFLHMQLIDLARTLSKEPLMDVEFSYHSYLDKETPTIHVSHFWNLYPKDVQFQGLKSDIYLRSYGNYHFTDLERLQSAASKLSKRMNGKFLIHVLLFAEDHRIEKLCLKQRPGTVHSFDIRKQIYQTHYHRQFKKHVERKKWLDAFFCFMVLLANQRFAHLPDFLKPFYLQMKKPLFLLEQADKTEQLIPIVEQIEEIVKKHGFQDMDSSYLSYDKSSASISETFDELTRNNEAETNQSIELNEKKEESEETKERLPGWHEETSSPRESFLQYDIDRGTSTDLHGEAARKAETGDQVFGSVQTGSQKSRRNEYSIEQHLSNLDQPQPSGEDSCFPYGEINRSVEEKWVKPRSSTEQEHELYDEIKSHVQPFVNQLKQSFLKTIEHKNNAPRGDLHFGRLSKKLTRVITEKNPRIFYKKQEKSRELDAVFTLLVDCSASMFDKMEETKKAIILFHETLKHLRIPHGITGFWEDAASATENRQPNYFHEVISFRHSLLPQTGPQILQLEPEEDNRDGYAIRRMAEELMKRPEKQKFLIVFSDGEPAAFNYEDHGVLDTYEAVSNAKKQGIETLGMFISGGEITEKDRELMKSIYGHHQMVVPNASELVDYLIPVLRRLLYKLT